MENLAIVRYSRDRVESLTALTQNHDMAARQRKKKEYSPQEILGMKIVAKILKAARSQSDNDSIRNWIAFLKNQTGKSWNIGDIQRYESAGQINTSINPKTGEPFGNVKVINPEYIRDVAAHTAYQYEFLAALASGLIEIKEEPIAIFLDRAQEKLGDRFFDAARDWRLSEEEIILAKRGLLKGNQLLLSAFLSNALGENITADRVLHMAIAQLAIETTESLTEEIG